MRYHPIVALATLVVLAAPAAALEVRVGGNVSTDGSGTSLDASVSAAANQSDGEAAASGGVGIVTSNSNGLLSSTDDGGSLAGNIIASTNVATSNTELGAVLNLIASSNWSERSLSTVHEINAAAYDVGAWVNADNAAALEATLSANADEIRDLQAALSANAAFSAWLDSAGTDASEVVAVGVTADGSLAVFTQ